MNKQTVKTDNAIAFSFKSSEQAVIIVILSTKSKEQVFRTDNVIVLPIKSNEKLLQMSM